jgi:hypothetical protein
LEGKDQLLKNIVTDLLSHGRKKEWKTYAIEENLGAESHEKCRQRWKNFKRDFFPKGLWAPGFPIEEGWMLKVERALSIEKGEELIPEAPDGWVQNKAYQQQTKEGGVIWLQSIERDRNIDIAQEFYDKSVIAFENIVTQYEPKKIYLLPQNVPTKWGFNLLTADCHVGATIKDSLFGERYSQEIYLERVRAWVDVIEREHQRYGTFKYLNVIGLGDAVDGYMAKTTRPGSSHTLPQDLNSAEQFDTYVKSYIDFFNTLVLEGFAEKIRFISATNSNHGGDFEYAASRAVEVYLNAKYPDIETLVSRDFIFSLQSGKHIQLLCHGKDKEHMKAGLPWILGKDNEGWMENYINYHGLNKHIPFNQEKNYISLYAGDLHQTKTEFSKRFRYKRIMSLMGGSDYVEYNFTKGSGYKGFEWEVFDTEGPEIIEGRHFYL